MQSVKKIFLLVFIICSNLQLQAMYSLKDGSQKEKEKKYSLCEKLFNQFVKGEKCERLFKEIVFDREKCCKILFNGDKDCYIGWLSVPIQAGNIAGKNRNGIRRIKKEITTLGDMLEAISHKEVALFKSKNDLAEELAKRVPNFFYEDPSKKIMWDSPTTLNYEFPSGTQEKICINGFIESLSMLLYPNFYFEYFQQDFALRCRIFVVIFVTLLLSYAGDEIPSMATTKNLFMNY